MPISRRDFLGCAAGASTVGLAGGLGWSHLFPKRRDGLSGCVLVDAGSCCTLPESLAGYESALATLNFAFERISFESFHPARMVIVPAAVFPDELALAGVRSHLDRGALVFIESGASFLNSNEFDFQRRLIRSLFGLSLHCPVRLWDASEGFGQAPYVDFHWPLTVKIRDFSRMIPVDCAAGKTIAWFHQTPVAARCRAGRGTLVFLGSPVGPHLLAGDREARNWFGAFCSCC